MRHRLVLDHQPLQDVAQPLEGLNKLPRVHAVLGTSSKGVFDASEHLERPAEKLPLLARELNLVSGNSPHRHGSGLTRPASY